jgi:hypothetical protein
MAYYRTMYYMTIPISILFVYCMHKLLSLLLLVLLLLLLLLLYYYYYYLYLYYIVKTYSVL